MTHPFIAIIGVGHMGESLLSGLIASGHPRDKIYACDVHEERLTRIRTEWGVLTGKDNHEAISRASIVLFAVKPQQLKEVIFSSKAAILTAKPLVISIAAGVRESSIRSWLDNQIAIVRAMPNMPALIQTGITALYATPQVSQAERNLAESVLRTVGVTVWMTDEATMDAVTAISGSGPAYFFYVMEALQQAGIAMGLPEKTARLLTIQTAFGAAKMVLESDESLKVLREKVTSKGGTTEEAIRVFEAAELQTIFTEAVKAATTRSKELAILLEGD